MTRITDQKVLFIYSCFSNIKLKKNLGPGPYNSLCHASDKKYFFGSLSNTKLKGGAYVSFHEEVVKIWRCEKGNLLRKKVTLS